MHSIIHSLYYKCFRCDVIENLGSNLKANDSQRVVSSFKEERNRCQINVTTGQKTIFCLGFWKQN